MKVKKFIERNPVFHCTVGTGLAGAAQTMKDANVGVLPVVDKDQRIVGIITDRDICLSLATHKEKYAPLPKVGEIMNRDVYTATAESNLADVLFQMRTLKVARMPVVDKRGKLKGIISLHKLLADATKRGAALSVVSADGRDVINTIGVLSESYAGEKKKKRKTHKAIPQTSVWDAFK